MCIALLHSASHNNCVPISFECTSVNELVAMCIDRTPPTQVAVSQDQLGRSQLGVGCSNQMQSAIAQVYQIRGVKLHFVAALILFQLTCAYVTMAILHVLHEVEQGACLPDKDNN